MSQANRPGTPTSRVRRPRSIVAALGLAPFSIYVVLFLALPTVLAVTSGLFDGKGHFTWNNFTALGDPVVLRTFWASLWLSLVTAAVGAILGAVVCYALIGVNPTRPIRVSVDAAAGVLAQFGGVMLAFVFIATMGRNSLINQWLTRIGINIYSSGMWLYDLPGLILPYIYFQVPLMVITFMPAMEGLKPQWAEANAALGGTRWTFWTRIGLPVLAPSFMASYLLLFANSFSAYATAAALASQGSQIVPLQIRAALTSETVLGRQNLAGALAAGMILVMIVVMTGYATIQRRAERWRS
ncbi:MAG: ABC transporter permease subunit [Propionibacteriaceae bacterium]|nr:ABC transporter permease subunit [Propionibacteriaceae bacterium]